LNRVMKTAAHDTSKRCMFVMALSRHIVWSWDKINLHFAQHMEVRSPKHCRFSTLKKCEWPIPHRIRFAPEKMSSISKGYETQFTAISSVESLLMILHTSVTRFASLQQYYIGHYTLSEAWLDKEQLFLMNLAEWFHYITSVWRLKRSNVAKSFVWKYDVFLRKREMSSILNLYNALGLCESLTPVKSQPPVSIVTNQHHLRVTPHTGSRL
jgi:hypothetical protein